MRKLILAAIAVALAVPAAAMEIGRFKNEAGGWVVFTDSPCDGGKTYMMYAYTGQATATGCWAAVNKELFVRWNDGTIRIYPMNGLTLSDEFLEYVRRNTK